MEKRKFSRVPFHIEAEINVNGSNFKGEVENLSLKGMLVHIDDHLLELGTPLTMIINLTGVNSNLSINLKGRVVRVNQEGIGIFFEEIDLDSFIHLKNIIDYNVADPEKVKEEFFEYIRENISKTQM